MKSVEVLSPGVKEALQNVLAVYNRQSRRDFPNEASWDTFIQDRIKIKEVIEGKASIDAVTKTIALKTVENIIVGGLAEDDLLGKSAAQIVALWDDGDFEREAAECADADIRRLHEVNQELLEALQELCECPQWVDEATIPKAGIDAAPQQVVINMSVGLVRLRNARAAIAKATGETP